jgi:hypothetical protein
VFVCFYLLPRKGSSRPARTGQQPAEAFGGEGQGRVSMSRFWKPWLLGVVVALASSTAAYAAEYGTLKGKFVVEGKTPAMEKIVPTKDVAVCGKHALQGEAVVVDKDGGLANAVIYALGDPTDPNKPVKDISPAYAKLTGQTVVLDNKDCRFEPHVAVVWTDQKFALRNSDPAPTAHNSFGQPFANPAFNPIIPAGATVAVPLDKPEKVPFPVSCSIHPWMKSYVISRPDPYVTVSKATGEFTIENLPVGEHTFQLWQETLGYMKKVKLNGKSSADRKGLYKITIKAGDNDIGKIVITAKDYEDKLSKIK